MPKANVNSLLNRMEADLATLRGMLSGTPKKPAPKAKRSSGKIPILKQSYTAAAAGLAKLDIDAAFEAGVIDYDKRRGMKMLVTKRTEGWSPV